MNQKNFGDLSDISQEKSVLETERKSRESSGEKFQEINQTKPNLQLKKYRREYYEQEKRKSEEIAKKTKEYYKEQKKRQLKIQQHLEDLNRLIEEEKEIKIRENKDLERKLEEIHKIELRKIQEKSLKRKMELSEVSNREQQLTEVKKEKPLYQKMEEKYMQDLEYRELEKRKAEIAKKRQYLSPVTKQNILDHIKKHDSIIKCKEKPIIPLNINETSNYQTKYQLDIIKQQKQKQIEEENLRKEKYKRVENRMNYAEVVREMYTPTIDKFKQVELALRLEKLKNPVIKKSFDIEINLSSQSENETKRKKIKKKIINEINKKADNKTIDYLYEMRELRKNKKKEYEEDDLSSVELDQEVPDHLSETEKVKILQEKAEILEKKARKGEKSLSSFTLNQLKLINNSEKINSMLISSIKAKLEILNHI
jgi:hypothetical protein